MKTYPLEMENKIHKIIKDSLEVEKVTCNVRVDNGRTVTQIEIVSRQQST